MSIESAQARKGFAAHNYAPSMDTRTSKLVHVSLPLSPGQAPARVLALMVSRSANAVRLVFSDVDNAIFFRTYIGPDIPEELQPSPLDSLEAFLGRHERLCEEAALLGSTEHGPLTLARAIDRCTETGSSMQNAMAYAKDVSLDCGQYCHRLAELARNLSNRP